MINLPLRQLNGSNSARQFNGSIFGGVQLNARFGRRTNGRPLRKPVLTRRSPTIGRGWVLGLKEGLDQAGTTVGPILFLSLGYRIQVTEFRGFILSNLHSTAAGGSPSPTKMLTIPNLRRMK